MNDGSIKIDGLLISAGLSGRMKTFKPLLKYEDKSFLLNIAEKLSTVCDNIVVVTGFKAHEVMGEFNAVKEKRLCMKTKFVFNRNYKSGIFSSIQAGLSKCEAADWVLLHFVDQPTLPIDFYKGFVNRIDENFDWIQPMFKMKKGHPLLLGRKTTELILSSSPEGNLKEISHNKKLDKKFWNCDYPQIFADIDTPEEYQSIKT